MIELSGKADDTMFFDRTLRFFPRYYAFGVDRYLAERRDLVVVTISGIARSGPAVRRGAEKLAADRPLALVLNGQEGRCPG